MARTARETWIVGSIGPATLGEAREAAPRAAGLSAVEIRLDALTEPADLPALRRIFAGKMLVATLRSAAEGGAFHGDASRARALGLEALAAGFDLVDVEYRSGRNADLLGLPPGRVIVSVHDLEGLPADLPGLATRMAATGARHVKIVATANDSRDALRLLEAQAASGGGNVTLIAMGEAGLATRVLSPYLGAPLAYAALVPGRRTAAGQVSAEDLVEVYGVGRPRRIGRLYALLAGRVSHSFSPALHNALFADAGDESLYVPFAMRSLSDELPGLRDSLARLGLPLLGASVTIPFKEDAAAFAGADGPVNTLLFDGDGRIRSANTDRETLEELLPPAKRGERALVIGAGGTGRTAAGVLREKGYEVFVRNRGRERGEALARATGSRYLPENAAPDRLRVLVNATPLGLSAEDPLPCDPSLLTAGLVLVDAPYRSGGTALTRAARDAGCEVVDGFSLLLRQAARQATLFTGHTVSPADLENRLAARHRSLFVPTRDAAPGVTR